MTKDTLNKIRLFTDTVKSGIKSRYAKARRLLCSKKHAIKTRFRKNREKVKQYLVKIREILKNDKLYTRMLIASFGIAVVGYLYTHDVLLPLGISLITALLIGLRMSWTTSEVSKELKSKLDVDGPLGKHLGEKMDTIAANIKSLGEKMDANTASLGEKIDTVVTNTTSLNDSMGDIASILLSISDNLEKPKLPSNV